MPGAGLARRALLVVLAAPAAALVRGSFTWRVPSDRLNQGEPIESAPFDCAGQRWTLKLSPRNNKRCGVELRYAANDVGKQISLSLSGDVVTVKVNGELRTRVARSWGTKVYSSSRFITTRS